MIPPSYLDELSLLQDQITPFSSEVAFNTIEQELGLPIDELFSEISPEPVAAASLGQVLICLYPYALLVILNLIYDYMISIPLFFLSLSFKFLTRKLEHVVFCLSQTGLSS